MRFLPLLALVGLAPGAPGALAQTAWVLFNVGIAVLAFFWGFVHLREIRPPWRAIWTWTVTVSALLALALLVQLGQLLTRATGMAMSDALLVLIGGALFAVMILPGIFLSVLGAAIGARAAGSRTSSRLPQLAAVNTGWIVLVVALATADVLRGSSVPMLLWLGTPYWMRSAAGRASQPGFAERWTEAAAVRWLQRRLVLRGARRSIDLRGAVLGLCAGAFVLLLGRFGLFLPLEAGMFEQAVRVRNQPLLGRMPALTLSSLSSVRLGAEQRRIVLLRLDSRTREKMLLTSSEAAVQSEVIRRLQVWGARRIVVPVPVLASREDEMVLAQGGPMPDRGSVRRSLADLDRLAATLRATPGAILLPPEAEGPVERGLRMSVPSQGEEEAGEGSVSRRQTAAARRRLEDAAGTVAPSGLSFWAIRLLPVLRLPNPPAPGGERQRSPLPTVLARALGSLPPDRGRAIPFDLVGRRAVLGASHLLINITAATPGRTFGTVDYAAVLEGGKAFEPEPFTPDRHPSGTRGKWVPPAEYFRDKIVLLESLDEPVRDTVSGLMSEREILGHATVMVVTGGYLNFMPLPLLVPGLLFLGAVAGAAGTRRAPLGSIGLAMGLGLVVQGFNLAAFFIWSNWFDPVETMLTVFAGALLSAHFTFVAERHDRQRVLGIMERYLPPQILDRLRDPMRELSLQGDRREVCVLFADTRNFTNFSERHPPELVVATTNRYLSAMTEALFAGGGILDKFTGDGLMAFFLLEGDPRAGVKAAVNAALALRDAAEKVSTELRSEGQEPLNIGIGLHVGPAVVGLVGSPRRPDYTVLGHTVVVSHRLQGLARGGEVVISSDVFDTLEGSFSAEPGDEVRVKGITHPVRPYRVTSLLPETAE